MRRRSAANTSSGLTPPATGTPPAVRGVGGHSFGAPAFASIIRLPLLSRASVQRYLGNIAPSSRLQHPAPTQLAARHPCQRQNPRSRIGDVIMPIGGMVNAL